MSLPVWRRLLFPLLFPLSMVYGLVTSIRNLLFEMNILKSVEFGFPVISVGNITVGGTGKTPHVEYLIDLLSDSFKVAMLSRGYKRKSKGYVEAGKKSTPEEIGDEPFQIYSKFPQIKVAVDADRVEGIKKIKLTHEDIQAIILDDAFQHRYVKPGVSILLIDYNQPVHKDCLLPAGNLRESADAIDRANIVIITKVPAHIKPIEKRIWIKQLNLFPYQYLYFTCYEYGNLISVYHPKRKPVALDELKNIDAGILLLTGIANPQPLLDELKKYNRNVETLFYPDHHEFTLGDLDEILLKADQIKGKIRYIVTTEKDTVKLQHLEPADKTLKDRLFYLPVKIKFADGAHEEFNRNIIEYVRSNKKISRLRR